MRSYSIKKDYLDKMKEFSDCNKSEPLFVNVSYCSDKAVNDKNDRK